MDQERDQAVREGDAQYLRLSPIENANRASELENR